VTIFEKTPILQALSEFSYEMQEDDRRKQLSLFDS